MVRGSLALLYFLLGFHGVRQGSSPDRGQSPVEWEDFPFICLFRPGWLGLRPGWLGLRPGWLGLRPGWLGLRPGWLGLRPGWLAQRGGRTDKRTDERKISPFYRTSSPIGAAAQKRNDCLKEHFRGWCCDTDTIRYTCQNAFVVI